MIAAKKPLKGQIWVFSGQTEGLSHQEALKMLEERGATVEREVTEFTDFLVVGNMSGNKAGRKLETAKLLGVSVVQGTEFKLKVFEQCMAVNRAPAAQIAGDIAKHHIRMQSLNFGLANQQGAIARAIHDKRHGKVGDETVVVGPNKSAEPFKTETVGAKAKDLTKQTSSSGVFLDVPDFKTEHMRPIIQKSMLAALADCSSIKKTIASDKYSPDQKLKLVNNTAACIKSSLKVIDLCSKHSYTDYKRLEKEFRWSLVANIVLGLIAVTFLVGVFS